MEFNIDATALTSLTLAVTGAVELFKRLYERDFYAAGIITTSAVVGAVAAPFVGDVAVFTGLLIGLGASGLITTATKLGGMPR